MLQQMLSRSMVTILPGKPSFGFPYRGEYDATYRFWLDYWRYIHNEVGLQGQRIDADDFLRHDIVLSLAFDHKVIGMIACTFLDFTCEAATNHSYINNYFGSTFIETIKGLNVLRLSTLENIFLNPEWRSSRVGFSLGAVMMAVVLKRLAESDCEGIFGAPRKDAPTSRICKDLGAKALAEDLTFHGKPTDLVLWRIEDIKDHPVREVHKLSQHLWNKRLDTTRLVPDFNELKTVA